jgi:hypothetical protein
MPAARQFLTRRRSTRAKISRLSDEDSTTGLKPKGLCQRRNPGPGAFPHPLQWRQNSAGDERSAPAETCGMETPRRELVEKRRG